MEIGIVSCGKVAKGVPIPALLRVKGIKVSGSLYSDKTKQKGGDNVYIKGYYTGFFDKLCIVWHLLCMMQLYQHL